MAYFEVPLSVVKLGSPCKCFLFEKTARSSFHQSQTHVTSSNVKGQNKRLKQEPITFNSLTNCQQNAYHNTKSNSLIVPQNNISISVFQVHLKEVLVSVILFCLEETLIQQYFMQTEKPGAFFSFWETFDQTWLEPSRWQDWFYVCSWYF